MNRGDTLYISLDYTFNDMPIEEGQFDEIEMTINKQSKSNCIRLTLSNGRLQWDGTHYYAMLTQEETFKLNDKNEVQTRFRIGNEVESSPIDTIDLGDSLSKRVL